MLRIITAPAPPAAAKYDNRAADLQAITPSDTVDGAWDFSPWLLGRLIQRIVSTSCVLVDGIDSAPASRLIGSANVIGGQVRQQWGGMVAGCTYRLSALIQTNAGETWLLYSHQSCGAPA
jgi:hypothetical protein